MLPVTHLSASALSRYRECPLSFHGKYIQKWPEVHPPFMAQAYAFGTLVHACLETHHKGGDAIRELCLRWPSVRAEIPAHYFDRAVSLIMAYTASETPDERDLVEHKFRLNIPGVEVPVIGYIDRLRGLAIKEYKTTSSKTWWTQERADTDIQATIYCMAVSALNRGAQATLEYHILCHSDDPPSHRVITTTRNKAEQEDGAALIRETWDAIKEGELRADCKPGRCRFPTFCREWGYSGQDAVEFPVDDLE